MPGAAFFDLDKTLMAGSSGMVFARVANQRGFVPRGQLAKWGWDHLRYRLRVGIEPADQHVPVFFCACCKVRNKGLNQIPIRFFQGWRAAEIGGVGFNESGIEIVLADQETELIPQTGLAIA